MKDYLIKKFKKARLQSFFRERESYQHQYAFVGVGNHSLSNLYPVLSYLNVPLKYIHTRSDSANKMASFYGGAQATDDLDVIGSDPAVKGVFISVDPEAHFAITKKLLEAGKKVFVEKPPCMTKDELQELISLENSSLLVGLQKRYSALNNTLRKSLKQVHSYRYAYTTGSYPEGDPRFDIFIHAIDNVIFLFGDLDQVHVTKSTKGKDISYMLQLTHQSGVIGQVELSTTYAWQMLEDRLTINCADRIYEADYPSKLSHTILPAKVMGLPLEKVYTQPAKQVIDYRNNEHIPIAANNSLVVQGYHEELKTFIQLCEGRNAPNRTQASDLLGTYELLSKMT